MNLMILNKFIASILIFLSINRTDPAVTKIYPVPPVNENSLFYLQRTKNTNAIVYEVNKLPDGKINSNDPLKIYWIRYSSDSTTADLTAIQRRYAYGMAARPYNGAKNAFVLQFAAYKKRNIFLLPSNNEKHYDAFVNINGKLSILKKIFIATSGGSFWFPKVDYIELTGKDPQSQQAVVERFVP
jgi:hypothetical protein